MIVRRIARACRAFAHRDRRGSVAIEFAILAWPLIALLVGSLQLAIHQYTQLTLANALFNSAAAPEQALLLGDQASYQAVLCRKVNILPFNTCMGNVKVEMMPLSSLPTTPTPITGTSFTIGASQTVMALRASVVSVKILPGFPVSQTIGAVLFRVP